MPRPEADAKTKALEQAIAAAAAAGTTAAVDILRAELDAHHRAIADDQPLEHRLSKARSTAIRLHRHHSKLQQELSSVEEKLADLKSQLSRATNELAEAQAAVANLAAARPKPAPVEPNPFGPTPASPFGPARPGAAPPPSASPTTEAAVPDWQTLLDTLRTHAAELPTAVQEAVRKATPVQQDTPMPPAQSQDDLPATQPGTIEPSKRDLQTLVDAQGIGKEAKRTCVRDGTPS